MRAVLLFSSAVLVSQVLAQDARAPAGPSDAEWVAKSRAIHARVLTLDTHKDIPDELAPEQLPSDPETRERFRRRFDPTVRGEQQVDFPKMREGGYDCAFFIVYVGQGPLNPPGFRRALAQAQKKFDAIERMARLHGEHIEIARSPDDVRRIHAAGKLVACIGIENGYPMGEDLSAIARFHEQGARYMSIAHNRHSQLGDSHTPAEPLHGGLSELGRKAIVELNRVGIIVDVSHAAKSTMMQAVASSKAPVIASHSGCRAVNDHTRNLDDEQLLALKENGGVIQCVALASFVKGSAERDEAVAKLREEVGLPRRLDDATREAIPDFEAKLDGLRARMPEVDAKHPKANVADFVDHIDHAVKLIGIDHVGISSDFDGGGGVAGWNDASETFHVTEELVRRGYGEADIAQLWSGNTLRVWAEVERVAAELQAGGGR
jgi:membrane dipeptidase